VIKTFTFITLMLFVFSCSSLALKPDSDSFYRISDAQMFLKSDSGDNMVGSGIMVGPSLRLYYEGVSVMGVGALGFAGVSSVDEAARLTGAPVVAPFMFFNDALSVNIGYRFAGENSGEDDILYGLSLSVGKLFEKRKRLP